MGGPEKTNYTGVCPNSPKATITKNSLQIIFFLKIIVDFMKLADQILLTISLDRLYQLNTSLDKLVAASHDFCQSQ